MNRFAGAREILAGGILALVAAGFAVRAGLGPGPRDGAVTNRAISRTIGGDLEGALADLREVSAHRPEDANARMREARVLRAMERLEESRAALEAAVSLDPGSARLRYELAKTLAEAGAAAEADTVLGAVLALEPDHADATMLRAGIAASLGDVDRSIDLWVAAIRRGASNPQRFRVDPLFDPVRHEPRFTEAVHAVGLPGLTRTGPS